MMITLKAKAASTFPPAFNNNSTSVAASSPPQDGGIDTPEGNLALERGRQVMAQFKLQQLEGGSQTAT